MSVYSIIPPGQSRSGNKGLWQIHPRRRRSIMQVESNSAHRTVERCQTILLGKRTSTRIRSKWIGRPMSRSSPQFELDVHNLTAPKLYTPANTNIQTLSRADPPPISLPTARCSSSTSTANSLFTHHTPLYIQNVWPHVR